MTDTNNFDKKGDEPANQNIPSEEMDTDHD